MDMNRMIGTDLLRCVNEMIDDVTICPLCIVTPMRIRTPNEWKEFIAYQFDEDKRDQADKIISKLIEDNKLIQYNLSGVDSCWSNVFVPRV